MKKRKAEPEIIEGFVNRTVEEESSPSESLRRITVHVGADNQIDWDKSKDGAADELLEAVTNDATMLEKIAASPEFADTAESSQITPGEGGMVLDAISMAEGVIFSGISKKLLGMKCDSKIVQENFRLSEEDHARQDPLAAQGLQMAVDALQINPKYKWAYLLVMAHSAFLLRAGKQSVLDQFDKHGDGVTPPNPATQTGEK